MIIETPALRIMLENINAINAPSVSISKPILSGIIFQLLTLQSGLQKDVETKVSLIQDLSIEYAFNHVSNILRLMANEEMGRITPEAALIRAANGIDNIYGSHTIVKGNA
jgi:hypothetical protein